MITIETILEKHNTKNILSEQDKVRFPWLAMLLNAYEVIDNGVRIAIEREIKRYKIELSCRDGCSNCCKTHKDIPVYPLELAGIYWYVIEKVAGSLRHTLKRQLANHKKPLCPFLVNASCSIYPVRPIACRQFNVFRKECHEGEDPFHTRRQDVLTPIREYTDKAFLIMLPFYGIVSESDKHGFIKKDLLHAHAQNLHTINWKTLSIRMDDFDYKSL